MRRAAAIGIVLLGASCSATPLTQLIVVVDSDLDETQLDRVEIVIVDPDGSTREQRTADLAARTSELPLTLPLIHRAGPLGPIDVQVAGLFGTREVVERRAIVTMIQGRTLVLEMHLERLCIGVPCDDVVGETCAHGVCRAATIDPSELRDFDGDVPLLFFDGGRRDGAECLPTELCNTIDDDCDSRIDEGITDSDPRNCGSCGNVCPEYDRSTAVCVAGSCEIACTEGYGDCDQSPFTGCEVELSTIAMCGECGRACDTPHGTPRCFAAECAIVECSPGWRDCNRNVGDGCEQRLDDLIHCGECATPCAPANATGSCAGGVCAILECLPGYANCAGGDGDGCETSLASVSNCGACGRTCGTVASGSMACRAGDCVIGACDTGRADCNASIADGCETALGTTSDCSSCGDACELAHATEICSAGACGISSCDAGWGDCDGVTATGCETPLDNAANCGSCEVRCTPPTPLCSEGTVGVVECRAACAAGETMCGTGCVDTDRNLSHCGGCDQPCAPAHASAACASGTCGIAACDSGWADCNGMIADGCERAVDTVMDCGSCDRSCMLANAVPMCAGGECAIASCAAGFADCDGVPDNGCETPLVTLNDCGGCGRACALENAIASCASGACEIVACMSGYDDCNDNDADGCETPLTTLTDCGGCGIACDVPRATESCASGRCLPLACDPGYADCDANIATGCETSTTLVSSCGSCAPCPDLARATETCGAGGTCQIAACDAGFADCNMTPGDGCEVELATSTVHCGVCGRACSAGEYCGSGTCVNPRAVVQISGGSDFTCARLADGRVYCWGQNNRGQLGRGTSGRSSMAVQVLGLTDAIDLDAGNFHACAVRTAGSVVCWGENMSRQLGDGTTSDAFAPVPVMMITDAVQVSAGAEHTCVVRGTGAVSCWGDNAHGQLGTSAGGARSTPMDVPTINGAVHAGAGNDHTCAVLASGSVYCWGRNADLQLGHTAGGNSPPMRAGTIADATRIATRADFNCVQRTGRISCWGDNSDGQLGDGTSTDRSMQVTVSGLMTPVQPAAGDVHACARLMSGGVMCWGKNGGGQLGDGTTSDRSAPVAVMGLTSAIDLSCGGFHTCAARADGTAVCWGTGADGRLGNGDTADQVLPVMVMGLP